MKEETGLTTARYALRGHVKCAAVKADGELITSDARGLLPMLAWLEENPDMLRGASVADRIVGRAAALLMIHAGVREVFAEVIGRGAAGTLDEAGIPYTYVTKAIAISNRRGDGICPIEKFIASVTDPIEAYAALREKLLVGEEDKNN